MPRVNNRAPVGDHIGFPKMFAPVRLTFGVFSPIEAFQRDEPTMRDQERLVRWAEELGFSALWFDHLQQAPTNGVAYLYGDMPPEILDLMSLFPQPMRRQPALEYLPGRRRLSRSGVPAETPRA
jgi:hypothetical protein